MKLIHDAAKFYRRRILPIVRYLDRFWSPSSPSKLRGRTYPKVRACPWCFRSFSEIGIKLHQKKCAKRPPEPTGEIVRPTDFDLPTP